MRRALAVLLCLSMALPTVSAPIAFAAGGKPKSRAATASRIVKLARKELAKGVGEVPDGSNRAPAIAATRPPARRDVRRPVVRVLRLLHRPPGRRADRCGRLGHRLRALHPLVGQADQALEAHAARGRPDHVPAARRDRRERLRQPHADDDRGQLGNAVRRRWRNWGEAMGYVRVAKGASAPIAAPKARRRRARRPRRRSRRSPRSWSRASPPTRGRRSRRARRSPSPATTRRATSSTAPGTSTATASTRPAATRSTTSSPSPARSRSACASPTAPRRPRPPR